LLTSEGFDVHLPMVSVGIMANHLPVISVGIMANQLQRLTISSVNKLLEIGNVGV